MFTIRRFLFTQCGPLSLLLVLLLLLLLFLLLLLLVLPRPLQYWDTFSYLFCLLFVDFIQLQKLMWEIKIEQTLAFNLLTST